MEEAFEEYLPNTFEDQYTYIIKHIYLSAYLTLREFRAIMHHH